MRCKNCGWENPQGKERCEKCNAPLHSEQGHSLPPVPPVNAVPPAEPNPLKGTLPESELFGGACKKCGYPIAPGFRVCPNCGEPVASSAQAPVPPVAPPAGRQRPGTINPWETPQDSHFCTLKAVAWQNEQVGYQPVSYSGDQIVLNRANTDPNNQSITSKEQAVLTFEDGAWYLEDRSDQKTTYVHAGRKTRLESGDIIILGNRRFEFKG
jgi:RNA polymerase subunit RPABC4/transcription elongation factor Spt4